MDKPLSYSAYRDYHVCPQYYKLKRIDKQPAGKETSALAVGKILDDSVMLLLQGDEMASQMLIEAELLQAPGIDMEFYADDLDWDLIDKDWAFGHAQAMGWRGDDIEGAIKSFLKEQNNLSEKQAQLMRDIVWQSLETKIWAMYNSFKKWIAPMIAEVHDVQLHLDDGETHGYLDFTATLTDGRKVLFDLKTSKIPYAPNAVQESPQLSLYAAMHGYDYAGYIVLCKTLRKNKHKTCTCGYETTGGNRKKCPECGSQLSVSMDPSSYSQIIVDKVPKRNKQLTKEAMRDTIKCIDAGHFPRNLNACSWMFGKPCPFKRKCWKNEEI